VAKEQYRVYLEKLEKEIHDDKMQRFVQQAVLVNAASPTRPKREIKRVDSGLGNRSKSTYKCEDINVSISPTHHQKQLNRGTFSVRPTEINHFTG